MVTSLPPQALAVSPEREPDKVYVYFELQLEVSQARMNRQNHRTCHLVVKAPKEFHSRPWTKLVATSIAPEVARCRADDKRAGLTKPNSGICSSCATRTWFLLAAHLARLRIGLASSPIASCSISQAPDFALRSIMLMAARRRRRRRIKQRANTIVAA